MSRTLVAFRKVPPKDLPAPKWGMMNWRDEVEAERVLVLHDDPESGDAQIWQPSRRVARTVNRNLLSDVVTSSGGTTPGNATELLRELLRAAKRQETSDPQIRTVDGPLRRAFHAMTGEYPEPEQVRAILSPEA